MACPNPPVMVDTSVNGTVKSWKYGSKPGFILLKPSDMPQQTSNWACFKKQALDSNFGHYVHATHVCAYLCATAQYAGDHDNWCLLSNATNAPKGSFCAGFPSAGVGTC